MSAVIVTWRSTGIRPANITPAYAASFVIYPVTVQPFVVRGFPAQSGGSVDVDGGQFGTDSQNIYDGGTFP
jgi:hypothetical protein